MIRDQVSRAKNLSAVTHISESMSDNETPEQVAANEKRLQETHAASLDVLMADAVGRKLIQERINQLTGAGANTNATPAAAAPTPGPSVDTTAVLKDLVQVLAAKTTSKKAKRKAKKAAKNKPKRAKSGGGNTTTDTSSSDSEDGGREDPIPQPLQRPYGKGSYDRETDDLFT